MAEHTHRWKVTLITTRRSPVLRCECKAWNTRGRIDQGEPPINAKEAQGLENRLNRVLEPEPPETVPMRTGRKRE